MRILPSHKYKFEFVAKPRHMNKFQLTKTKILQNLYVFYQTRRKFS